MISKWKIESRSQKLLQTKLIQEGRNKHFITCLHNTGQPYQVNSYLSYLYGFCSKMSVIRGCRSANAKTRRVVLQEIGQRQINICYRLLSKIMHFLYISNINSGHKKRFLCQKFWIRNFWSVMRSINRIRNEGFVSMIIYFYLSTSMYLLFRKFNIIRYYAQTGIIGFATRLYIICEQRHVWWFNYMQ